VAHFVDRTSVQVGEDLLTTSTQFLDLEELPSRIVFFGGGYIALLNSYPEKDRSGGGCAPRFWRQGGR
jgi:hypothetical protein